MILLTLVDNLIGNNFMAHGRPFFLGQLSQILGVAVTLMNNSQLLYALTLKQAHSGVDLVKTGGVDLE